MSVSGSRPLKPVAFAIRALGEHLHPLAQPEQITGPGPGCAINERFTPPCSAPHRFWQNGNGRASMEKNYVHQSESLEIIAFRLNGQEFCVRTTSIREIRGWAPVRPLPHAPYEVLGVMNLRGTVIPIVDLAAKLGMQSATINDRSAIVVTDVRGLTIGLLVDGVSDILTVSMDKLQPIPAAAGPTTHYADGIVAHDKSMICFLNLERMFADGDMDGFEMVA